MKKSIYGLFSIFFLLGCGGGGGSGSSSGGTPEILLTDTNVELMVGETRTIRTKVSNMPENNSSIETTINNRDAYIVDYVTYTISNSNDKSVNLLLYGANEGNSVINLIANSTNDKITKSIKVKVSKIENGVDIANGNINTNNIASGITSISKIFPFSDGDVFGKLDLQIPSTCGEYTFINDSKINFEKDSGKVLINLNLFRYNTQGDREFSKFIKNISASRENKRENNETVVIPSKAIEVVGMDFALNGVSVNDFYKLEVETDMCKAEFKLKLSDLVLDTDLDGVGDDIDRCPNTPLGSIVDEFGCSIDVDGDGVEDANDLCPNTPLGVKVNKDGCADRDGDGVADIDDSCPDVFGVIENNGCPLPEVTPTPSSGVTPTPSSGVTPTPSSGVTPTPSNIVTPTKAPTGGTGLSIIEDDTNACTTNGGYAVASHTMGESSFSNGIVYFRTLTPYPLSLYYKVPTSRNFERAIDLNSFQLPGTNYKFFLEISPILANGGAFYVQGQGVCYKAYFPTIDQLNRGIFPNKDLTLIER